MKTLFLEKRGCDFWQDEPIKSDINNYRVVTKKENIKGKDGNIYFLAFSLWRNKGNYRKTTKNGKRELIKPIWEIDKENALSIATQFTNRDGCWRNIELEKKINLMNLSFTQADILKAVNIIAKTQYNKIVFVE